ncbi:hypothetical protein ECG_02864 [Echinococcus granulosus]|uniref:Uncharacterized protein n=1 Tax=Echinococcus granulosus TaxID=6210 RepID=A0A068WR85_ECHGR|nr:hypothetical protein ECG_02864 [Echinococcus granulosus]CDS20176.1 hypothetical protein EgrG_000237600 [Echinococcus granulosus]
MRVSGLVLIPCRELFHSLQHSALPLLLLMVFIARLVSSRVCFRFEEEVKACAKKCNLPVPNDQSIGYDFGYGSLNETEEMCRTRGHITIFQCMQRILEKKCQSNAEERYLKTIWSFTLDTRRSEQAAIYLCKEHNLQIFRRHRNGCLRTQEKRAEVCSQTRNSTMLEVVNALRSESLKSYTTPEIHLDRLKSILEKYECKSIKAKLDCLYNLLRNTCHPDATLLILNYFKETLPPDCVFSPSAEVGHKPLLPPLPPMSLPNAFPQSPSRRRTHAEVMSDFPHARYVNDGFYDDPISAHITSSSMSLTPFSMIYLILLFVIFPS